MGPIYMKFNFYSEMADHIYHRNKLHVYASILLNIGCRSRVSRKLVNKQSSCWWFEMPWYSSDVTVLHAINGLELGQYRHNATITQHWPVMAYLFCALWFTETGLYKSWDQFIWNSISIVRWQITYIIETNCMCMPVSYWILGADLGYLANWCGVLIFHHSDVTGATWCLTSLAAQWFVQQFVQQSTKKMPKLCVTDLLWGELPLTNGFPAQRLCDPVQQLFHANNKEYTKAQHYRPFVGNHQWPMFSLHKESVM